MPQSADNHSRVDLPVGTVTFLFTDIEGSTWLVQHLGPEAYRELLERHHQLLRRAFSEHGGAERGTQGDAFLVIFRDARSAVGAALDAQLAISAASWPAGIILRVRMGLHSGEGIPGADDYVGIDVNRAARIAAAAHGGQIVLSDSTRALAERDLPSGATLRDLGLHRLKDLETPEHLFMLVASGLEIEFPPLRSSEAAAGSLPTRMTAFIGRMRELDELQALLAAGRLVTLTGPGGTGKTSLAIELARRTIGHFSDGTWFVPVESITHADLIPSAILTALGLRETGSAPPADLVRHHLRERSTLLLIDNLEQIESAASVISGLLQACPGLKVLATSRAPLRVVGEQEYAVAPLRCPEPVPPGATPSPDFRDTDAMTLFVDRARRAIPSFNLTSENELAVAETCRRLDGLPLAIELAAARVGLLAPADLARRLAQHLPLPGAGARDLPERQRTVERAIAWSHELLALPERVLFARLSVFAGGWELDAAAQVCGRAGAAGVDILDGLAKLVDQSLVRASPTDAGTRFTMLETIRAFAAERLAASAETSEIRSLHGTYYLELAERAAKELPGRRQVDWLRKLDQEQGNLRAAVEWAIDAHDAKAALRLASAMWRYWQLAGNLSEGIAAVDALLAVPGEPRSALRMRAMEAQGGLRYWSGDSDGAIASYSEQLALARDLGAELAQADALLNLATTIGQVADSSETLVMLDEAYELYATLDDRRGVGRVTSVRGFVAMGTGDPVRGSELMEEALVQLRAVDDVFFEAVTLMALGWTYFLLRRFHHGLSAWRESMALQHALGDVSSTTLGLEFAAIAAAEAALWEQAATIQGAHEALASRFSVRAPRSAAEVLARPDYAERTRQALGPDLFEASVRIGSGMSAEAAYDFAVASSLDAEARLTGGSS